MKWSEEVLALLAETDKTSCKSVCIALGKAAEAKDTKAAAMAGVKELCDWAKEQKVYWTESFVVTLFPTILAVRAAAARPAAPPSAAPSVWRLRKAASHRPPLLLAARRRQARPVQIAAQAAGALALNPAPSRHDAAPLQGV